jgi:hypothetical protein
MGGWIVQIICGGKAESTPNMYIGGEGVQSFAFSIFPPFSLHFTSFYIHFRMFLSTLLIYFSLLFPQFMAENGSIELSKFLQNEVILSKHNLFFYARFI